MGIYRDGLERAEILSRSERMRMNQERYANENIIEFRGVLTPEHLKMILPENAEIRVFENYALGYHTVRMGHVATTLRLGETLIEVDLNETDAITANSSFEEVFINRVRLMNEYSKTFKNKPVYPMYWEEAAPTLLE